MLALKTCRVLSVHYDSLGEGGSIRHPSIGWGFMKASVDDLHVLSPHAFFRSGTIAPLNLRSCSTGQIWGTIPPPPCSAIPRPCPVGKRRQARLRSAPREARGPPAFPLLSADAP